MKNSLQNLAILFFLSIGILFSTSCSKEDANEEATNDLLGTWTMGQSTVDLTVDGVDLVEHMATTLGIPEQQAEAMVAFFTASMQQGAQGTITFKDDNTYQFVNSQETENGTYSIGNDGQTLTLNYENEVDNLTIVSLSSSNMQLALPQESEEIDLDGDDENETTVDINMTLNLSK